MFKVKHFILLSLLIAVSFCLTGCVKYEVNITLDRNGNAQVTDIGLISDELLEFVGDKVNPSNIEKMQEENPDVTFEKYEDEGYTGLKAMYAVKNIDKNELFKQGTIFNDYVKSNTDSDKMVNVHKGLFVTNYEIDWIVDYSISPETGKRDTDFLKAVKSKIVINIPAKAKENNATRVENDGHTYVWVYDTSTPENSIILKYSVFNILNILLCFLLIAIFAVISILLVRKNAKNNNEHANTNNEEE